MSVRQEYTIRELIDGLIGRAQRQFPNLTITGEIATISYETVYRMSHHKAIEDQTWLAIVSLTSRWKSEDGQVATIINRLCDVICQYDSMVDFALSLQLFKLEEFMIAKQMKDMQKIKALG